MPNNLVHTVTIGGYTFTYNREEWNMVTITLPLLPEDSGKVRKVQIPYGVLREFIGQVINKQLISRLESLTGNETLNAMR